MKKTPKKTEILSIFNSQYSATYGSQNFFSEECGEGVEWREILKLTEKYHTKNHFMNCAPFELFSKVNYRA